MTAALIIGIVSLIVLASTAVASLHIVRQSVSDAFRALERVESRNERHLQTVLDRLMTIRWEDYAAIQASQDDEEGGFIAPSEQRKEGEEEKEGGLRQIFALRNRLELSDEEEALLKEDFPEEMT